MSLEFDSDSNTFGREVNLKETQDGYDFDSVIKDEDDVKEVSDRIFKDADEVIRHVAKIRRKMDGIDPPFNPSMLKQEGKGWKSNVNTGFMKTITSKVAPRLFLTLDRSRHLIASALPPVHPVTGEPILDHSAKTDFLRTLFTRTLREWAKWHPFIVGLAEEVSNFGHGFVAYTDDIEWRPTLYRLDQAQVPTGTELLEQDVPFFTSKDSYLLHELFEKIINKDIAEEEGWNIENVVESINKASPPSATGSEQEHDNYLLYEDLRRELVPSWSFLKGAKTIEVRHVFGKELDGQVSQAMVDANTGKMLFKSENRYGSMSEIFTTVTFNYGNGKVHGVHGLGQEIYDLAVRVEKTRNQAIDNIGMRGKLITQVNSPSELKKARTIINDENIMLAGQTVVGNQAALPSIAEDFLSLDRYFNGIAEQRIGAFLPPAQFNTSSRTATEASIAADREEEVKEAILEFWLKNISIVMHMIARRMFSPDTIDNVAQDVQQEALKKVSQEELSLWANQSPRNSLIEFTQQKTQEKVQFAAAKENNPFFKQFSLQKLQAVNVVGSELAEELLIDNPDQSEQSVAAHSQLMELTTLRQGTKLPILETDNDIIHILILRGQPDEAGNFSQGAIAKELQNGNQEGAQAMIEHYQSHVEQAKEKGELGEQQNTEKEFAKQIQDTIRQLSNQQGQTQFSAQDQQQPSGNQQDGGRIPQTPDAPDQAL